MKILGVTILMLGLLISFSLSMDILLGFDLNTSLRNAFNPFLVMETAELAVLFLFISSLVIESARSFYQARQIKTNKQKK